MFWLKQLTYRTVVLFLQWRRAIVLYWLVDHLFSCLRRVLRKTSVSPETHTNGVKKIFCFERFCACTKYINFYLYTPCAGSYARKVIRTNLFLGFWQQDLARFNIDIGVKWENFEFEKLSFFLNLLDSQLSSQQILSRVEGNF